MEGSSSNVSALEHNETDLWRCESLSEVAAEAIFTSLIIILILCILGNSAICIIVSRHYQLHTVTNAYFVNMAVIQLLFAFLSIPPYLRISSSSMPIAEHWLCVFIGFSFEMFAALSNLALTLLTIERYYVISNSGRKKISAKTTSKMIFAASVLALTFAILWTSLVGNSMRCFPTSDFGSSLSCFPLLSAYRIETLRILNIIYILMCFLLPMALMAGLFVKMAKPLWSGFNGVRPMGVGNTNTIRFFAEIKTTRTLFLISLLHLCCWLPLCITSLYLSSQQQLNDRHSSFMTTKVVSICLAFASSCINPLMYALRNPRFSIIFRPNKRRRSHGKKRVHFKKSDEQREKPTSNAVSWAQRPKCSFVYDTSRSEETQTTSSC